jgi:hypothetical protein
MSGNLFWFYTHIWLDLQHNLQYSTEYVKWNCLLLTTKQWVSALWVPGRSYSNRNSSKNMTLSAADYYYYYYYYYLFIYLFIPLSLRTEHRDSTVPRPPRLLFQFLGSIRHLVGLLSGGISPVQGLYLHRTTQHRNTQTHIHAPRRIRTCDPNVRAAEESTCLRPRGHWDRRYRILANK